MAVGVTGVLRLYLRQGPACPDLLHVCRQRSPAVSPRRGDLAAPVYISGGRQLAVTVTAVINKHFFVSAILLLIAATMVWGGSGCCYQ